MSTPATPATGNHTMHFVCMECKREYKTLHVARDLTGQLDQSHAWCPECEPKVQERWFGNPATRDSVEALR